MWLPRTRAQIPIEWFLWYDGGGVPNVVDGYRGLTDVAREVYWGEIRFVTCG